MYESQITAAAMLLASLIIIGALLGMFTYYEDCVHAHGVMETAGVAVLGIGICMFRLLRGSRTSIVKYIHLGVLVIATCLICLGWFYMYGLSASDHVHAVAARITVVLLFVQLILGVFLFTYLYEYRTLRINFAPIHDVFGVFLYVTLVGVVLAGHHGINSMEIMYEFKTKVFNTFSCVGCILVVLVIVGPYFEWELIGYL